MEIPLFIILTILVTLFISYQFNKINEQKIENKYRPVVEKNHFLELNVDTLKKSKLQDYSLLNEAIIEVSKLSGFKEKEDIKKMCGNLARIFGKFFNAEFCGIGFSDGEYLEDYSIWLNNDKSEKTLDALKNTKKRLFKETLVGNSILKAEDKIFLWSFKKYGNLSNEKAKEQFNVNAKVLDTYRSDILSSGEFTNMAVSGIYNDKGNLLGYIHLINKTNKLNPSIKEDFSNEEKELIKLVSNSIAVLIENIEFHEKALKDEKEINKWYGINNIETLFQHILKYLNKEFNSINAAYLMLANNGFEDDEDMVVLRAFDVNIKNSKKREQVRQYISSHKESEIEKSVSGRIIMNTLPLNDGEQQDSIRFINYREEGIEIIWNEIETDNVICIPIMKSPPIEKGNAPLKPEEKIWGVITLQPKNTPPDIEATRERLKLFSKHVQTLIERTIYKRRYNDIENLNQSIQKLNLNLTENKFYQEIVKLVKTASNSEDCSIFLSSKDHKGLYLKATTAQSFISRLTVGEKKVDFISYINQKKIVYSVSPTNSISSKVLVEKRPVLVYDIENCKHTNFSFMEETDSEHKSLIAIPLIDNNGNAFGVLRCINKKRNDRLLHVFIKGDLDLLQIITGILSGYIKYVEYGEQKNSAMTHFGHESRGPMQTLEDETSILKFLIKQRLSSLPNDIEKTLDTIKQAMTELENKIKNTETMFLEKPKAVKFKYKKQNLHFFLSSIAKLFSDNNRIIPDTKNSPELFIDENYLHQVFYNLILNAKRYSNKGAPIKITYNVFPYYPHEGWHEFKVINWGIGIQEGEEKKIFDIPYYRTERAKKKYPTGTGIGLKICKDIVEKHDGKIFVSRPSSPTIFSILLPKYLEHKKPFK